MHKILEETETAAYAYFQDFGFSTEEIEDLLKTGKRDIIQELSKLRILIDQEVRDTEKIDQVLHALKGLFSQLGNRELADKVNEVRSEADPQKALVRIEKILFV